MSFSQGVSGLDAAAANLDVIGNNIANSGTVGYKSGSVQFSNVYAGSMAGLGTKVAGVFQDFTAGAVQRSARPLDVAIVDGNGFFRMTGSGGEVRYTRNGQFDVNKDGFIVNAAGLHLTGFAAGTTGALAGASAVALQVPTAAMAPVATQLITAQFNIDARSKTPVIAPFNAKDSTSYNYSNSVTMFDSLGNSHELSAFFVKTATNKWDVYATADGLPLATGGAFAPAPSFPPLAPVPGSGGTPIGSVGFDSAGKLVAAPASAAAVAAAAVAATAQATAQAALAASPLGIAAAAATAAQAASPLGIAAIAAATAAGTAAAAAAATPADTVLAAAAATAAATAVTANATAAASVLGIAASTATAAATASPLGIAAATATSAAVAAASAATPTIDKLSFAGLQLPNGSAPLAFNMTLTGTTQFGSDNQVRKMIPDGYASGQLTTLSIAQDGSITGKYSNQQTKLLGQVVLSSFQSPSGLQNKGENVWAETPASGAPLTGTPGSGKTLGSLLGGAVEGSNVDLTAELINLIIAQRTYQANTQTVKTQDQVVQALINLR